MGRSGSRHSTNPCFNHEGAKKLLGAFASIKADPRQVGDKSENAVEEEVTFASGNFAGAGTFPPFQHASAHSGSGVLH